MIKSRLMIYLIISIFLMSFISAQGCADEGWKGYGKIFENKTITITCSTCNFINFTATNSNQEVFLSNVEMIKDGSSFSYTFLGNDLNSTGIYQVDGYSNLDLPLGLCFDITMTGKQNSIGTYSILLLLGSFLFIFLIWINIKFNTEKRKQLYKKIVDGYFNFKTNNENNLGQVIVFFLGYSLIKNLFIFYYLIIVFFMFVLTELVESFGISSLIVLFTTLLNVFLWGFVLVFVIMIFGLFELIKDLIQDVSDSYMGAWKE